MNQARDVALNNSPRRPTPPIFRKKEHRLLNSSNYTLVNDITNIFVPWYTSTFYKSEQGCLSAYLVTFLYWLRKITNGWEGQIFSLYIYNYFHYFGTKPFNLRYSSSILCVKILSFYCFTQTFQILRCSSWWRSMYWAKPEGQPRWGLKSL